VNTAHLQRLADAATRRAADRRLPIFVREHWSHMATGWLRRWEKAQLSRCSFADAFRNRINFQSPQP